MRKFFITLVVIASIAGGFAVYLISTTPKSSAGVPFPLSGAHRALLAGVPADADAFALIPTAAALEAKLRANPITRAPIEEWSSRQTLPRPWMIGGADLVAWRQGKQTRYLVRLDPVRAFLVRVYQTFNGDAGDTLLITTSDRPPAGEGIPQEELARIAALAARLPAGDALVVQRASRNAFPPIGRPAVTSVQVHPEDVVLTSRAALSESATQSVTEGAAAIPLRAAFPRGAMLTVAFSSPPRSLSDLNRLFGAKVASLLDGGGELAIYDVETRKLVPRPRGVIAVPADPAHRAALDALLKTLAPAEAVGVRARTGERDGRLLLSFDDSLDLYLKDATDDAMWPAARWAVRIDPRRLVPILQQLHDDLGLRVAAPHVYQSAKDLNRWIGALENAERVDAEDTMEGDTEQLQIRMTAAK
jgi:hypothetical protein